MHYYRHGLAFVHDRGHGQYADTCAPGILGFLSPVKDGIVLELGCAESSGRTGPDWAIITRYSQPAPDRFVRDVSTFVPDGHGAWRRDSEHHENVLVDTSLIPALLREHGVDATVGSRFGAAELQPGLKAVTGTKDREVRS